MSHLQVTFETVTPLIFVYFDWR